AFFCMLGYVFSQRLSDVIHYAERGVLIFGWTVGTIVVVVVLVKRFRRAEERAKLVAWLDSQEREHPRRAKLIRPLRRLWERAVMPIARWMAPKIKFGWNRLTPGGLGIEFTTAAAVAVVAGYTYYVFLIAARDWPTNEFANRINDAAFRIADSLRTDWIDEIARGVTHFGALPVAATAVAVATALCLWRRRIPEAIMLTISLLLTVLIVQTTKSWTEVPRPPNPLAAYDGYSFPSGHAAYATAYVTIALTLERIGLIVRAALLVVAILVGGAVALSRVYLRVHYLTDAIGGTAVGFLSAALVSGVVLVAVHMRDRRRERADKVV
ncbi:MAG: phosphatase PAP2 family protein, partial [Actinobacteria bacterium]|nr:phosphatase PAP2 family protein [Actinomycetota bacterium]